MSGEPVRFTGDGMAAVVEAVRSVERILGAPPVVVGGLAVLCRLTVPYRATTDVDVVDARRSGPADLEVLRSSAGARPVEPSAVLLPTAYGEVRVDVLEVRQADLDRPSDDPGDRLHASAHAWAAATATAVEIEATATLGDRTRVVAQVAEPGPLVAMKLQAVMDRGASKQGTDLHDIVSLVLDTGCRESLLDQLEACDRQIAVDVATHVDLWFVRRRTQTVRWIRASGGPGVSPDDVDLVAELLTASTRR